MTSRISKSNQGMKERQFGLVEVMACLRFSLFGNPVSKSHRTKTHELSRKVSVA